WRTAASGIPTMLTPGSPRPTSASISTSCPPTPDSATAHVRPSATVRTPPRTARAGDGRDRPGPRRPRRSTPDAIPTDAPTATAPRVCAVADVCPRSPTPRACRTRRPCASGPPRTAAGPACPRPPGPVHRTGIASCEPPRGVHAPREAPPRAPRPPPPSPAGGPPACRAVRSPSSRAPPPASRYLRVTTENTSVRRRPGPLSCGPGRGRLWRRRACGESRGALLGEPELGLVQLLDVDVLECQHAHVLDEPRWSVHVPHPGVGHPDVEVHLPVCRPREQLASVGETEATLRLDDVGELPDDVAVLAVQRELHLGLVVLQILGAHLVLLLECACAARRTLAYDMRWMSLGPSCSIALA